MLHSPAHRAAVLTAPFCWVTAEWVSCRANPAEVTTGSEVPSVLSTGFMLIGSDVKLNSPSSLVGQALTEVLQHPERARDALRVLLHLVRGWGALTQAPMEQRLPEMHRGG